MLYALFSFFAVEFHTRKGFSSEVDIFITQTVLQYLCLKKHIVAALGEYRTGTQ